jgi:uncharacterized protein
LKTLLEKSAFSLHKGRMLTDSAKSQSAVLMLDECEEGISQFDLKLAPEDLELSDESFSFSGPVQVSLRISRSIETFTIEGAIHCPTTGECCRCLEPVEQSVEASMRLLMQRKQASEEELEAVEDQEFEILDPGAREIDLKAFIREDIILELPPRVFCAEDCKGLCPQCGLDLNKGLCSCREGTGDARWAALGKIEF